MTSLSSTVCISRRSPVLSASRRQSRSACRHVAVKAYVEEKQTPPGQTASGSGKEPIRIGMPPCCATDCDLPAACHPQSG